MKDNCSYSDCKISLILSYFSYYKPYFFEKINYGETTHNDFGIYGAGSKNYKIIDSNPVFLLMMLTPFMNGRRPVVV